jgi:hypothetical protein
LLEGGRAPKVEFVYLLHLRALVCPSHCTADMDRSVGTDKSSNCT